MELVVIVVEREPEVQRSARRSCRCLAAQGSIRMGRLCGELAIGGLAFGIQPVSE